MKQNIDRCDACGRFVPECSLVCEMGDDDEPTDRSICKKCDSERIFTPTIALKPEAWLSMLPAVVSQLEPEKRNEFLLDALRKFDAAGVEIAGCAADGIVAMEWGK